MNYYNEIDPYCCEWLRNLIAARLIPAGDVDDRDIRLVRPADLVGYAQCHFFAGIGGWSLALELAGWGRNRPVWTGSCPCQPFSAAGQRQGMADKRHLWPEWFRLIRQCRPAAVFGEQVDAGVRQGWLDAVFAGLEGEGYACGAGVLPAAGVGAPHLRQRLWFVAQSTFDGRQQWRPEGEQHDGSGDARGGWRQSPDGGGMGDPDQPGSQGRGLDAGEHAGQRAARPTGELGGPWCDVVWLPCRDGKARPTQPGLQPLAHGVPARVGRLRAYGNAITPQVAAAFIGAYLDVAP